MVSIASKIFIVVYFCLLIRDIWERNSSTIYKSMVRKNYSIDDTEITLTLDKFDVAGYLIYSGYEDYVKNNLDEYLIVQMRS